MAKSTNPIPPLLHAIFFLLLPSNAAFYNVVNYGADPTGRRGSTKAFLTAWTVACRSKQSATIIVPAGKFLLGAVNFQGPCNNNAMKLTISGTLLAPVQYSALASSGKWIMFNMVSGLSVTGGTLDARGARLWACKLAGRSCPLGATSLTISRCNQCTFTKLTIVNSQMFHSQIHASTGVRIEAITISAPGNSPNTDGIHVQYSDWVTIIGASIRTGDDCISVGPGTTNLYIESVKCGPGHGISIGSLANSRYEPGVQNVTVKTVTFTGTQNGLRIKTWARPSSGFVSRVFYQNIIMQNVQNPIAIDQNYCPSLKNCPTQGSGIKISDVVYTNIRGTSATQAAVKFDCSPVNPCKGISLQGIQLSYRDQPALSFCKNAKGSASGVMNPPSCL